MGSIQAQTLQRAASMLGGKEKLRELLRVPMRELESWLAGSERPPLDVFLKAVDVVSEPPSEAVRRSRELRRASDALKAAATRSVERARLIQQAILEGQAARATVTPQPTSALGYLEAKFEPQDGKAMVEAALDAAIGAIGADMGNVQLARPDGLHIVAQRGFEAPFLDFFAVVHDVRSACSSAMNGGRRVVITDVATDPLFAGTPTGEIMAKAGVRAVQSTPLVADFGRLLGVLSTHWTTPREVTERMEDVLDHIAHRTAFWLDGGRL
jgi:hypothetical protein